MGVGEAVGQERGSNSARGKSGVEGLGVLQRLEREKPGADS